ncbi:inversin-B-like [Aedes albopictus]|uniref:Uncharacterized protein n=1 Tax=Aedes albopictus TaxID=7160 RepID=A0ABM1YNX2_AEDAL
MLIKDSNDMIFGTVQEIDSNLLRCFVVSSDSFYIVRLTSTEPLQPLKTLVNAGDKNGETLLHMMAIRKDSPQTIALLLENGANPIAMNTFMVTPLHIALVDNDDNTSMLYLNHCVEHDLKSRDGTSALEVPNGQGCRPIHYAAMLGKFAAVQFLLKHNVNVRVLDQIGYHPACYAAGRGFPKILRIFLEYDPTLIDLIGSRGQTLLHISTKSKEDETIMTLLEYDVSIAAVDYEGKSPVEIAIGNGNVHWLKVVLFYARINGIRGLLDKISDNKMPMLHYAVFSNKIELLTALVEYELDADFHSELSTSSLEVLRRMLTRTMPELGYNALHVAVQMNFKESVQFLMTCQAWYNRQSKEKISIERDAIDLKGMTPLDYALNGTDETMINLLLSCE